ncbi:MAG: hypothetical protein ACE5HU_09370 [Acidobacteriota bacterium]
MKIPYPVNRRSRILASVLALAVGNSLATEKDAKPADLSIMPIEEVAALAQSIRPRIEQIRGLKFKRPVPVHIVDDAAARAHFKRRLQKFWPEKQMRLEQKAMIQLGLLPAGVDLEESLLTVLEEQTGGYYDPGTDTFYVLGDMPRSSAPILIAHELTHALDDQYYDIDSLLQRSSDNSDRSGVVGAVVEGSGMLVMSLYIVQEMGAHRLTPEALKDIAESEAGRGEKLKAAPEALRRSLLAPYLLGQTFLLKGNIMGLLGTFHPEDIDRVFRDPPASTEQLLHPDKYWKQDPPDVPLAIALPDLSATLGEGWSLKGTGDLGELMLGILVGTPPIDITSASATFPSTWTNAAATGWGGDRWQLYAHGADTVTLLATLWDTPADASEFVAALARPEGSRLHVRSSGSAVVIIAGESPGPIERIASAALRLIAGGGAAATGRRPDPPRATGRSSTRNGP